MPPPHVDRISRQQTHALLEHHRSQNHGQVASYYPPETEGDRDRLAIAYTALDGAAYYVGDHDHAFPLYSISKVFTYGVAPADNGRAETPRRVGVEPRGDAFNSFAFDERNNRPFNPMVAAGAPVAANLVHGRDVADKVERVLDRLRICAANPRPARRRGSAGHRAARAKRPQPRPQLPHAQPRHAVRRHRRDRRYLPLDLLGTGHTRDLATTAATLANGGANPLTGERAFSRSCAQDVLTVMSTCGMYNTAGEWGYDAGLPAKSGVAGGIMFAIPESFGCAVFSPGLDFHGNSVRGVNACRHLSQRVGLHEYGDPNEEHFGVSASEWASSIGRPSGQSSDEVRAHARDRGDRDALGARR